MKIPTDDGNAMATRALPFIPALDSRAGVTRTAWCDAGLMLLLAFALRCWWFGDPVIQVDEQFYLLVGDRLLHGALPYVDIWDRKPIGLFLVYAAARLLGGDGIVQYQAVAALCAGATAFLVTRMARRVASGQAARLAGAACLVWTIVFDGAGGQAPVIYNPLVAAAALTVLRALAGDARGGRFVWRGTAAMALIGLAIQIKYTAVFEGVTMGLVLLWEARRRGLAPRTVAVAALWVGAALLPTILAFAAYALAGHGNAFFYANFLSIGDRPPTALLKLAKRAGVVVALALPLLATAILGLRVRQYDAPARRARWFLAIWLIGALVGFVAIGSLYKHYFLPVVPPLAAVAAPGLDAGRRDRWRRDLTLAAGVALALFMSLQRLEARGGGQAVRDLAAAIRPRLRDRLFVFDGEPILYHLTGAALASRFAFPNHLNERKEAPAIGVDQAAEVTRVMASRPSVVVVTDTPATDRAPAPWGIVRAALARDYEQVAAVRVHRRWRLVYAVRRGATGAALPIDGPAPILR